MADGRSFIVSQFLSNKVPNNISRFMRVSCVVALVSGTTFIIYNYLKKSFGFSWTNSNDTAKATSCQVLFFPDKTLACRSIFSGDNCTRSRCPYAHEDTSLSKLIKIIMQAKSTLDVCVFTINLHDLADIVVNLHKEGVVVRVLTDDEQMGSTGSQIEKFRREGIRVRHDLSSFFMHHKFVIIDGNLLVNGSFNWTRQAVTGNRENVVVINHPQIVKDFCEEFEKLWDEYDPANQS